VKLWLIAGLVAAAMLGGSYFFLHREEMDSSSPHAITAADQRNSDSSNGIHPPTIEWQKVDRPSDGFRVEMPVDIKQIAIPAYTETGGTQQVSMIFSNPTSETTFSVSWQDDPPVARAGNGTADRTLELARDGALARTQTSLVSEKANNAQGFPGTVFESRNTGGGVMNSRLVYAGSRLYMLNASFPSASARRNKDVSRFFNSFTITAASGNAKAS
jgi:hypothetical protein